MALAAAAALALAVAALASASSPGPVTNITGQPGPTIPYSLAPDLQGATLLDHADAQFSWDPPSDAGSGIDHYEVQLWSPSPNGVPSSPWTQTTVWTNTTSVKMDHLPSLLSNRSVLECSAFVAVVRAVDTSGNYSGTSWSPPFAFDLTAPAGTTAWNPYSEGWTNSTTLRWEFWPSWLGDRCGVQAVSFAVGATPGPGAGPLTTVTATDGVLAVAQFTGASEGQSYYLWGTATDWVGHVTEWVLQAVRVDTTPPGPPAFDPQPAAARRSPLVWRYTIPSDASGWDHFEGRVLDDDGAVYGTGAADWWHSRFTFFSFKPPHDGNWTLELRAVDAVGNVGASARSTVTFDTVKPSFAGKIHAWFEGGGMHVTWPQADDGGSGVLHYVVFVGTAPEAGDIFLGNTTDREQVVAAGPGGRFFVGVFAVDRAGNEAVLWASDIALEDRDAPPPAVTALVFAGVAVAAWAGTILVDRRLRIPREGP